MDTHRGGYRGCPELTKLLAEGLVKFSPQGRLIKVDDSELPFAQSGTGGVASVLRAHHREEKGKAREVPPHMAATSMPVGIYAGEEDVFAGGVYAIAAPYEDSDFEATPAERTAKRNIRFEPASRKDQATGIKLRISPKGQPPSITVHHPEPLTSDKTTTPALRPTVTTETVPQLPSSKLAKSASGRTPKTAPPEDVEMKDVPSSKGKGPSYRITTDVQETVSVDDIQATLLNTQITLTLRQILAMSPELQKQFSSVTKARREYMTQSLVIDSDDSESERMDLKEEAKHITRRALVTLHEDEDVEEVIGRYIGALTVKPTPLFAMTTGKFKAVVAGKSLSCMVDTGSELNVISGPAFDALKIPLDIDGSRWTLKGVSGAPLNIQGCARDVPIEIGGHRFDHHFFAATRGDTIGKQDVILGQPWLQWYSATIAYHRNGPMTINFHPNGDDPGPELSLQLVQLDHHRNMDRLVFSGEMDFQK